MVARPSCPGNTANDYSSDDDRARLDRLCADVADAEGRIAGLGSLAGDTDWMQFWQDRLAEYQDAYGRIAALQDGGA